MEDTYWPYSIFQAGRLNFDLLNIVHFKVSEFVIARS